MHVSAAVPVDWPREGAWLTYWGRRLRELEEGTSVRPDGLVVGPDGPGPAGDAQVRLTAGTHLQPGALYEMTVPGVRVLTGAGGVGGTARNRLVNAQVRNAHHPGRWVVDLDSLDDPARLAVASDMEHLALDLEVVRDRGTVVQLDVRLDWLRVRATVDVRRAHAGDELAVGATVTGRGRWRPVLAPILAAAGPLAGRAARRLVADLAGPLGDIARDPDRGPLSPAERRDRHLRDVAGLMVERTRRATEVVAAAPWWRRRRVATWTAALSSLPDPTWPDGDPSWTTREAALVARFARRVRWGDPAWVGEQLLRDELGPRGVSAPVAVPVEASVPTAIPLASDPPLLTDADLDLSWLASPWSTVRRLTGRDGHSDAEVAGQLLRDIDRETAATDDRPV